MNVVQRHMKIPHVLYTALMAPTQSRSLSVAVDRAALPMGASTRALGLRSDGGAATVSLRAVR